MKHEAAASRRRSRRGLAALEFALCTPAVVVLILSLYDLTQAIITTGRVDSAAQEIALIASGLAVNTTGVGYQNVLTAQQVTAAASAASVIIPGPMLTGNGDGVTVSMVVMVPTNPSCTSSCAYTPKMAWTVAALGSTSGYRSCGGTLAYQSDTMGSAPGALPTDTQGQAPVLVVDVRYTYQPLLLQSVIGQFQITRSAYFPLRIGDATQWARYSDTAAQCPGYTS